MNGKGSKRRPSQISQAELERRWQQVFGSGADYKDGLSSVLPVRLGEIQGAASGVMPDITITMDVAGRAEDGKHYAFKVDSNDGRVAYFTDSPIDGKVAYNPSLLDWTNKPA